MYSLTILKLKPLFVFPAEKHFLKHFITASSGVTNFPDFMAEMVLDNVQGGYCDSNGPKPRDEWTQKLVEDDPKEMKFYIDVCVYYKYTFRGHVENLMQQCNQSQGMSNFRITLHLCGCWQMTNRYIEGSFKTYNLSVTLWLKFFFF